MYDTSKEPTPGIYPGANNVLIAGFNGKRRSSTPQGMQIFNLYEFKETVPDSTTAKDFTVPEAYGKNVKIEPTADE